MMLEASQRDLRFQRRDLHVVASTARGCLKTIPGKKSKQKVAVGDATGVVHCFALGKSDDVRFEFSTSPPLAKPIGHVDVFQDQIFFTSGDRVTGVSKKGKPFFVFDSGVAEALTCLRISTPYFFTAGEFTITSFQEATERGFLIAPDKVNDLQLIAKDAAAGVFDVFVACQDRVVRLLREGKFIQDMPCPAPALALAFLDMPQGYRDVICGTASGAVVSMGWTGNGLVKKFSRSTTHKNAGVGALAVCDITKDGYPDIVLGHDDGTIELLSYELNPDNTAPASVWKGTVPECITSLVCGTVTNPEREDIILSTFSGKIICFAFDTRDARLQASLPEVLTAAQPALPPVGAASAAPLAPDEPVVAEKLRETEMMIRQVTADIDKKKREYQAVVRQPANAPIRAAAVAFTVRDTLVLQEDGTVRLGVEVDTPIDFAVLTTLVPLDLTVTNTEGVTCSMTPAKFAPGSTRQSAVYRCVDPAATRLHIVCRPTEGQYGGVQVTVVPRVAPKAASVRNFSIRPLSLHQRVPLTEGQAFPEPATDPNLSVLVVSGAFSARDAHAWIFHLVPDVPEVLHGDEGKLAFMNVFQRTQLFVRYRKGELELFTSNVTTLAVAKAFVTKEATSRKIAIRLNVVVKQESCLSVLELLRDRLEHQATVARQVKLVEGLREIEVQEQSVDFLLPEYQDILARGKELEEEHRQQGKKVQYLNQIVSRLYQERQELRGDPVSPAKMQQIQLVMTQNFDYAALVDIFSTPN